MSRARYSKPTLKLQPKITGMGKLAPTLGDQVMEEVEAATNHANELEERKVVALERIALAMTKLVLDDGDESGLVWQILNVMRGMHRELQR